MVSETAINASTHAAPHAEADLPEADDVYVEHQFDDAEQQHLAATLGMWVFLATEVMFFGGLFTAYAVYRSLHPSAFVEASRLLNVPLGAVNTAVLLISSLTMALAVRFAQLRRRQAVVGFLLLTMLFGTAFLGVKAVEWTHDYHERLIPAISWNGARFHDPAMAQMFFVLYFCMTGLHALHLIIGVVLVGVVAYLAWRGWFSGGGMTQIENTGLYWHFIDIVWVFLYPLLYLIHVK
jgi:cytochrome c oxidase subunit 3